MYRTPEIEDVDQAQILLHSGRLNTSPEAILDDLAQLAAYLCHSKMATIIFVDRERHLCKACVGFTPRENYRSWLLDGSATPDAVPCIIPDTRQEPRFARNLLGIDAPTVCFYAAVPLIGLGGMVVGALEVMDNAPRLLSTEQVHGLEILARQVVSQLELHPAYPDNGHNVRTPDPEPRTVEERLRYQQAILEMASRAARMGGWMVDVASEYVYWSDEVCAIHDMPPATSPTLEQALQFYPPEWREIITKAITRAMNEGTPYDLELEIITAKGRRLWVRTIGESEVDANGMVVRVRGAFQDVTEQKQAEIRVQQLATWLTDTLESITDAFFTLDHQWRFVYVNREAERLLKRTRSEMLGSNVWELFRPAIGTTFYEVYHRAMVERRTATFDEYYAPLDIWLEVRVFPTDEGLAVYFRDITEQRQAREELRESEARFRQLAENIEDVFWVWDSQTYRVLYVSPRYETLFGRSREELYREPRSYLRAVHPEDRSQVQEALTCLYGPTNIDYRAVTPDGKIRWVNARVFPIYDESGALIRNAGICRDITPVVQATDQLRESEQQYRLLFTNNPHPMWVYDRETLRFLAVNDAAILHYGYSETEFLSMTIRDIRPHEDIIRLEQILADDLSRKQFGVWRHCKKDGTLIDVEILSDELPFNGRSARLVLALDVTERRQAEVRLREQAMLLDKAQEAIFVCNLDYQITYLNQSAARLYGGSNTETTGKAVIDLLCVAPDLFAESMRQVMVEGEWHGELAQVTRDGREILNEGRWTLVRDEEERPFAILMVLTDITERKKLQTQLLRSQRLESIGTLAGGIAHDFNNILTPILLYSEQTLGLLSANEQAYANLEEVLVAAQRARDLVFQILSFSCERSESPRQGVRIQPIVQEVLRLVRAALPATIEVHQHIDPRAGAVHVDPAQIHQVVMNLCTNAYHAMQKQGGKLTVRLESLLVDQACAAKRPRLRVGSYVRLTVKDTGHGIEPSLLSRIFDPFFTTKAPGEGTGLGLSVVYGIVTGCGGDIEVESQPNVGTSFQVYLPVAGHETAVEESLLPALQQGSGHILLVDDEEMIVDITTEILANLGYTITGKRDSREALELFQAQPDQFDLLITDLTMPHMSGTELIHEVLKVRPDFPILLMSGGSEIVTSAKPEMFGARAMLRKPFSALDLSQMTRSLLQR